MDEVFEEMYELLDLYFQTQIRVTDGYVKAYRNCSDVESQLDEVIFREELKGRIIALSQNLQAL